VPYDASISVVVTEAALSAIAARGGAADWVARRARGWLAFWSADIGIDGFYPFDLLAAAYLLRPDRFDCTEADAWVADDAPLWRWLYAPRALMLGTLEERPPAPAAATRLVYCLRARRGTREELIAALAAPQREAPCRVNPRASRAIAGSR
jgi:hypothetical protein